MINRISFKAVLPDAFQAMLTLSKSTRPKTLTPLQVELIKVRASQINGCSYCIELHVREAKAAGETEARINLLPAWREIDGLYSEEERALLALTEEITFITTGVSETTYESAAKLLQPVQIAEAIMTAATINTWNRILKTTHAQPTLNG